MTNIYHATPYDISATGFYFRTYDEYQIKAASHHNAYGQPVEEYEIQFVDGDNGDLFDALGVTQATLETWFDDFADMEGTNRIKAIYLSQDLGLNVGDVLNKLDDVVLFEGTAFAYAENYLEETGLLDQVPESLQPYLDVEALARDMILGGDIAELEFDRMAYVVWGA